MKKDNLLRCIAIFCIAILAFLSAPEVKAQNYILDKYIGVDVETCLTRGEGSYSPIEITVNDTIVIIDNIYGRSELNDGDVTDDYRYKFCGPNGVICDTYTAGDGEFRIRFQKPAGTDIGVNKISFDIIDNSATIGIGYTVTFYQGGTGTDDPVTDGNHTFVFENCVTEFDSIIVSADYDADIDGIGSLLFVLDNLIIASKPDITNPGNQTECDSYTLPTITGTNLTGNEAYYTGSGGTGTQYDATNVISSSISTLYIYDETGTTPNCYDEESFSITVNPLPNVSIGSYGPYCINAGEIIITGTPMDVNGSWEDDENYIHDNGDGTASFYPNLAEAGDHILTYNYIDGNECINDASVTVTVLSECPEVVCVIDLSGSMKSDYYGHYGMPLNQRRIEYARKALKAFTELLNLNFENSTYYGLVGFKNLTSGAIPADCQAFEYYSMNILNSDNFELIEDEINNLNTGFRTPLLAGLDLAKDMFQQNGEKTIILLSDGAHNCPQTIDKNPEAYANLISQINNLKVYTIGFGQSGEVDLDLLADIATETGGEFYDLTNSADENIKVALNPGLTNADVWDAGEALKLAYSQVLTGLGLEYSEEPMGILTQGVTEQFYIPVSGFDGKICFFISWVTSQPNYLGIKIKTSNNIELPAIHPDIKYVNRDNYTIVTVSGSFLNQQGIVGNNPWKLEIDASNINAPEKFQYFVLNKSKNLKFNTWFDKKWYYTGDIMRIYLELLVENKNLTNIDKTFIQGSMPVEGHGNIMAGSIVTLQQLEEFKKFKLENVKRLILEQAEKQNLDSKQKQELLEKNINSLFDNMTSNWLKAQIISKERKGIFDSRVEINGLQFNDEGSGGDEKAGDGVYTAEYKGLIKEGLYLFNITAIDTSKGKNIKRESQISKFVRVNIKSKRFVKDVIRIDTVLKGKTVYNIALNLRDRYSNIPHPNSLRNIKLNLDKGELIGHIQANPDGTFTQMVSLPENVKPRQVKMTMNVYDQVGEQRLESRIPRLIYIIIISVILIITGVYKRNKNRQRII